MFFRKHFHASPASAAIALLLCGSAALQAKSQAIPQFPGETNNSPFATQYGLGMTQFQNGLYGTAMLMVYPNGANLLSEAISANGQNFTDRGTLNAGGTQFQINCNAGNPETCTPAITVFNGTAYVAFAEQTTGGLYVLSATPFAGNVGYNYNLVYTSTSVNLTSAPAMIVSPNGANLIIRYGTSNIPNQPNATFVTTFNGSNWNTVQSGGFAPTQSGLANFNGSLYAIDKQNNSSNGVFVSRIDNNGIQIPGTPYQIPNATVKHGFSAVTYNGSIIFGVQANAPQKWFYVFSSNNGSSWATNLYSNITTGNAPQLALFNQGVTEAHQANDSSHAVYSALGY